MRIVSVAVMYIAASAFGLGASSAVAAPVAEPAKNLIVNPSFEEAAANSAVPAGWSGNPQVYSLDSTAAKTGKASLKYVNDDPKRYALCYQAKVPVRPGWKCRFSVWVKTQNIAGNETGATICMEWQGKDGKWLGGAYPDGIRGTHDWTLIEHVTRLPENAVTCNLSCYVRKGMTGTAWFDDVQLVRVSDPPMQSVLLSPVYRGQITSSGPYAAQVRVRWNLIDHDLKPRQLRVCAALIGPDKKCVGEASGQAVQDQQRYLDLRIPFAGLAPGTYDLAVRMDGPDGKELQTDHHRLVRLPDGPQPKCFIDQRRRLIVDGKPMFPLGLYWGSINAPDLEIYSQSKFNCLMPYGSPTPQQMDLAHRHGLKVIYSIKDWYAGTTYCPKSIRSEADEEPQVRQRVRQFRDHPALLAWYLNDELSQRYMPRLEAHQRWVAEEDPNHPTWAVLYQYREVGAYLKTFDVIGTDPYPIGRQPASMAAEWTAETFRQVEGARPLWQVPQLHNWANYAKTEDEKKRGRTPTYDEVRSMAWQCICEGAQGLVFYCWHDLKRNPDVPFAVQWEGLKRIAAEIDQMAPVLLSIEPPAAISIEGNRPKWLRTVTRTRSGKLYLVAVNDGDGEGRVEFRLPATVKSVRLLGGNRPVQTQDARLSIELPRLAVQCYEIDVAVQ